MMIRNIEFLNFPKNKLKYHFVHKSFEIVNLDHAQT